MSHITQILLYKSPVLHRKRIKILNCTTMKHLTFYIGFGLVILFNGILQTIAWVLNLPQSFIDHQRDAFSVFISILPEKIRQRLPWFDMYGLRHSRYHLQGISLAQMIDWPIEAQAKYADVVTVTGACSNESIFHTDPDDIEFHSINATGIGNVAYTALHHPSGDGRQHARLILSRIQEHFKLAKQ